MAPSLKENKYIVYPLLQGWGCVVPNTGIGSQESTKIAFSHAVSELKNMGIRYLQTPPVYKRHPSFYNV